MEHKIEIITDEVGKRLNNTINLSIESHTKVLEDIRKYLSTIDKLRLCDINNAGTNQHNDLYLLLEFNAYLNIAMLDIASISRQLSLSKLKWENSFYIKHGHSIIYETINTYNKLGNKLKNLITKHAMDLNIEYKEIGKDLRQFKKDYNISHIENVRNNTAAHIGDLKTYFEIIDSLDILNAVTALIIFVSLITRLMNLSIKLVVVYNSLGLNPLTALV